MNAETTRNDYDRRSEELWASVDEYDEEAFRAKLEELVAGLPADSPIAAFERACAFDSTGHSDRAVPLYRSALELGLDGERRRRAVIQLSSSLRNLGQVSESLELLSVELKQPSDRLDDGVSAFLALALVDSGRERAAVSVALAALAPHLPRYQRSLGNYARELVDGEREPRPGARWGRVRFVTGTSSDRRAGAPRTLRRR
jgi:tetratricopeptide (TPR) repeat protein